MKTQFSYPNYFTDAQKQAMDKLRDLVKPFHALYLLIDEVNAPYDILIAFASKEDWRMAEDSITSFNHEQLISNDETFLVSYLIEGNDYEGQAYEC